MNILGVSAGFHDAALTVLSPSGDIVFAGHSERYSKKKNDADLCAGIVQETFGMNIGTVAYYERPWLKQLRQGYAGQGIEWNKITVGQIVRSQLKPKLLGDAKLHSYNHHRCHAAAGFQTSTFDRATIVVIDAVEIGRAHV